LVLVALVQITPVQKEVMVLIPFFLLLLPLAAVAAVQSILKTVLTVALVAVKLLITSLLFKLLVKV
jgi:hypothetical protein